MKGRLSGTTQQSSANLTTQPTHTLPSSLPRRLISQHSSNHSYRKRQRQVLGTKQLELMALEVAWVSWETETNVGPGNLPKHMEWGLVISVNAQPTGTVILRRTWSEGKVSGIGNVWSLIYLVETMGDWNEQWDFCLEPCWCTPKY